MERACAAERELGPATVRVVFPRQWGFTMGILSGGPPCRQPELGAPVTAILDERQILTVGDQARGEAIWLQKDAVPWPLVVEGEPLALLSDRAQATIEREPYD